jgi:L-ascorbate metabolism protein UlaG (beta-lactamase superfamily)
MRTRRILIALGISCGVVAGVLQLPAFGAKPAGERRARAERSGHYRDGAFSNLEPTNKLTPGTFGEMLHHQFFGEEQRVPAKALPVLKRTAADYATPPASGLRATWIGHATVLLEIDGKRVLTDPVFSARCSPFQWIGPERFAPPPIALDALPPIDAVVVSHDHYDHLDQHTITKLAERGAQFVVPLGIGAHLERWDVAAKQITDLDWHERKLIGDLQLTATPARHYSGRGVLDGDATLWASWVIAGPKHRVFFSGDTGYSAQFAKIGAAHGPFDLTLIKVGASDPTWQQIHMSPEEALKTHRDVRGRVLLPVHWGTFNLAYHDWHEPAERVLAAARKAGVTLALPRLGEWVEPPGTVPASAWWR